MATSKTKLSFVCQECGYDTPAYLGKCPECSSWNSFKEFRTQKTLTVSSSKLNADMLGQKPQKLIDVVSSKTLRIQTKINELNTVTGGGIVLGSVTLMAGDPGIGKSTLLLQLCLSLAREKRKILYISGEESAEQIKMRAQRIKDLEKAKTTGNEDESFANLYLLAINDPEAAIEQIEALRPDLVIVDSIQTMESVNAGGLSGSVGQVRYAALSFVRLAKSLKIPVILVGHVTKEGMVAGPMVLSHMVDTVLFLEGEKFTKTRILRCLKNRFGPVDEVGIFLMEEFGMQEVTSPDQLFQSGSQNADNITPGSVIVATLEGTRAFLVEIQSLVVSSRLPMPRRVVSGLDQRRVELLLAVLQKHVRLPLESMDVFVNVAGGLKLTDPAVDLGICLAVFSSLKNIPLKQIVGIAEVGLQGELRSVSGLEKRVREAQKLGYKNIITAKTHLRLQAVIAELSS